MTSNVSLFRTAALTGAAAFLFSFAHVAPAAAQARTRIAKTCTAQIEAGSHFAYCNVTVPAGKRFVIESATAVGIHPSNQSMTVSIFTKVGNGSVQHAVPGGFQVLSGPTTYWSGNLAGTIFGEPGPIQLSIGRLNNGEPSPYDGSPWIRMTLSGYLEDMPAGLLY
jgi:hypothetical protein